MDILGKNAAFLETPEASRSAPPLLVKELALNQSCPLIGCNHWLCLWEPVAGKFTKVMDVSGAFLDRRWPE